MRSITPVKLHSRRESNNFNNTSVDKEALSNPFLKRLNE